MERLKQIRKELDISQKRVAEYLKISREAFSKIEKRGCSQEKKNIIICFYMMECSNGFSSRVELGVSKNRLSEALGISSSLLSFHEKRGVKTNGIDLALEKEQKRRLAIKQELNEMLKFC